MKNYFEKLALAIALALIFIFSFFSILNKSMIWDERCYIGAGKYILKTGNFEYNVFRAHPPLSFYINSIFLLPLHFDEKIYAEDDCWQIGYDMVYHSGYSPQLILTLARLPFILMSMILALFVFSWARQLYGIRSGFLALGLYAFSTSIISQSNLALTDFTVAFFIFLTIYYYWKFREFKQKKALYLTSLFFGLSLLSKLTGLVLMFILPILILYDAVKSKRNAKNLLSALKILFIIFIIGFLTMFVFFGFQFKPLKSVMPKHYADRAYEEFGKKFGNEKIRNMAVYAFEKIPIPFPQYFFGLGAVGFTSKEGIFSVFLDGKIFLKSPWYYPVAVFFYKTQISMFLLLIISIIIFKKTSSKMSNEYAQMLPMIFIFIIFMLNNMTAGLRHILPIYPFMFVFSSKIAKSENKWIIFAIAILIAHYMLSSLLIFPHYFAYFNEFAGGASNGYKHLVGANLDNGQDLPGLKKFMEDNNINKINLSYFGSVAPNEYVNYDYMPSPYFQHWVPDYKPYITVTKRNEDCSKRKGWTAISATNLQNVHMINKTCFDWLKKYEPAAKIGYSIFVYDIN